MKWCTSPHGDRNRPIKVLIIGAAGTIRRKLTERLAEGKHAGRDNRDIPNTGKPGSDGNHSPATLPAGGHRPYNTRPSHLPPRRDRLRRGRGGFRQGYRINLDGTRLLSRRSACRSAEKPQLVFTSSMPFRRAVQDDRR